MPPPVGNLSLVLATCNRIYVGQLSRSQHNDTDSVMDRTFFLFFITSTGAFQVGIAMPATSSIIQ